MLQSSWPDRIFPMLWNTHPMFPLHNQLGYHRLQESLKEKQICCRSLQVTLRILWVISFFHLICRITFWLSFPLFCQPLEAFTFDLCPSIQSLSLFHCISFDELHRANHCRLKQKTIHQQITSILIKIPLFLCHRQEERFR